MALIGALLWLAALPGGAATAPPVKIVTPKPTEIASSATPIEVTIAGIVAGVSAPALEIMVDGKTVAHLDGPPYRTTFDFGQSLASRVIVAKVVSGPLSGQSAEVRTRGFDPKKIDATARVDLVTLFVSVRNRAGKFVTDLGQSSFSVFEDKAPQRLAHFSLERRPLVAAIVLDVSLSMKGEPIEAAKEAAMRFIKSLAPEDRAMVISFSDEPRVLSPPTTDRSQLAASIASIEAKGGTALYDAIYMASGMLAPEEGRKVLVLLSDGRDEAQSGLEPGSFHTFDEALEKSLRSEVILFTIGFGKQVEKETDFYGRTPLKEILKNLAESSGGSFHYPQSTSQLKSAYDLIGDELRNQFSLAYSPASIRADGSWHAIRVEVKDPGLKAFTRRGYYAPKS